MSRYIPASVVPSSDMLRGKRIAVIVFSYFPSDPRVFREAIALAGAGAEIDLFCLRKSDKARLLEPAYERYLTTTSSVGVTGGVNVFRSNLKKSRAGKLAYV